MRLVKVCSERTNAGRPLPRLCADLRPSDEGRSSHDAARRFDVHETSDSVARRLRARIAGLVVPSDRVLVQLLEQRILRWVSTESTLRAA